MERWVALFKATNICAEDEGLARSARSVGKSVLFKASEDRGNNELERIYALIIVIMLVKASESCEFCTVPAGRITYRKYDSVDSRDFLSLARRI